MKNFNNHNHKLKFITKATRRKPTVKFESNVKCFGVKVTIYTSKITIKITIIKSNQISHPYKIRVVPLVTFFSW